MVQIYPKQFSSRTVKILHARSAEPFKIFNKINYNTYVINLPREYSISCTFNVNDLVNCKGFDCSSLIDRPSSKLFFESPSLSSVSNIHPITVERINKILDDKTITTKSGGIHRYLIH